MWFFIFFLFIYFVNRCIVIVLILYIGWIIVESCGWIINVRCVLLKLSIFMLVGMFNLVFCVVWIIFSVILLEDMKIVVGFLLLF